jgi:hypothetical protein
MLMSGYTFLYVSCMCMYDGCIRTTSIWQKCKRSKKIACGLFLVHLNLFFSPGYLSGIWKKYGKFKKTTAIPIQNGFEWPCCWYAPIGPPPVPLLNTKQFQHILEFGYMHINSVIFSVLAPATKSRTRVQTRWLNPHGIGRTGRPERDPFVLSRLIR